MVKEKTDIENTLEPECRWGTSVVKNGIGHSFDSLDMMFSIVLVLLVGLRLPVINTIHVQDIIGFGTNFNPGTVTDQLVHSSPFPDVVLKGVGKLLLSFHAIDVSDMGLSSNINLSTGFTSKNDRSIRKMVSVAMGSLWQGTLRAGHWDLKC